MKPIVLIAANFLREHRWPVLLLFAWIVLMALAAADFSRERTVPDDVLFYLVQQGIFICVFCAFLAAGGIHNDRKSRRILLVLSKAVSRTDYLLALLLGTCAMASAYVLVYGVCGVCLTARAALPGAGLWPLAILVFAGSVLSSTVALFFSTFLNPYVSIAATVLLFAGPGTLHAQRHLWAQWLPGFPILLQLMNFSFSPEWKVNWMLFPVALLQSLLFCMMAAVIFNRRDIAIPVE